MLVTLGLGTFVGNAIHRSAFRRLLRAARRRRDRRSVVTGPNRPITGISHVIQWLRTSPRAIARLRRAHGQADAWMLRQLSRSERLSRRQPDRWPLLIGCTGRRALRGSNAARSDHVRLISALTGKQRVTQFFEVQTRALPVTLASVACDYFGGFKVGVRFDIGRNHFNIEAVCHLYDCCQY